jgi:hypothetical protein
MAGEWEYLSDALKRAMGAGIAEDQAKLRLCRVVYEANLFVVQFLIGRPDGPPQGRGIARLHFKIPERLEPADLDWEKSRPVVPWPVNIVDSVSFDHPSGSPRFHIRVQQGWDVAAIPPEVLADDCGGARWRVHSICLLKAYVTEIFGIQVPELKKPNASAVTPELATAKPTAVTPAVVGEPVVVGPKRRPGPAKGASRYARADRKQFPEMRELIDGGLSPHGAALKLGAKLAGGGTLESRAKRLATRYIKENS